MLKYSAAAAHSRRLKKSPKKPTVSCYMKKSLAIVLSSSFLMAAQTGFAACDYPKKVDIPNGTTASEEEMLEGQNGVKQFVADMEAYLDCIVAEEKAAREAIDDLEPEAEQQREDLLTKKYNAAVEDMEKVAARFNAQVQAFRSRDQ